MRVSLLSIGAAAIAAIAMLTLTVARSAATEIPPCVDEYAAALKNTEDMPGRQSLQDLFELGIKTGPGIEAVLDALTDSELKRVQDKMRGVVIVRGPVTSVHPSSDFFKKLARKKGTKTDRAFFDIYARTEPDANGGIPAYIERRTDET